MMPKMGPFLAFVIINIFISGTYSAQYLGKLLGKLSELHHGVSGEVYAVDGRTLYIKDFTYDGQGPAAYFYASTGRADKSGFRLRDENGSPKVIRRYRKEGITITLPEGKTLNNIKIFYVWCEDFDVNFGDIKIPRSFDYPRPQRIEPLKGVHDISSDNIVIVDAQTLLIPHLSYDGEAPDAKFWVGRGLKPTPQGIRVADENGKMIPLRRYDRKTVVLTLPGDLTVFDIGHFGIWCEAFTVDFGHIAIPQSLNVPPSLRMLGVSPQSKLNCEVLYDDLAFEVRWAVAGDSIVLQLVAKLDDREYMSFGLSGDDTRSEMLNGDVVVAWLDKTTLKGYADDYHLAAKSQCSGPTGSCPDSHFRNATNNVRLLNAAMVNGYSIITYQRPLRPSDEFDRQIHANRSQAVIWAIGPLNQKNEVSFHAHYPKTDRFIDFGRAAKWNCPMPEGEQPPMTPQPEKKIQPEIKQTTTARGRQQERRRGTTRTTTAAPSTTEVARSRQRGATRKSTQRPVPTPASVVKRDAWEIPPIQCYEPEDGVFYAQMGPTGGKHGYPAITGHVGWGISWYINGLLIPEINVVRGKTYTFVVEGGADANVAAKYHPFYITDDEVGGYEYKTEEERKKVKIFAGVVSSKNGEVRASGTGRLCHWTHQGESEADDFESFGAYQRTLELKCDEGEPGVIQWTPDEDTPDTVYYQCFTHRYLGWKINVHDKCEEGQGSELSEAILPAPSDLEPSPSQNIETRVNDIVDAKSVSSPSQPSVSDLTTILPFLPSTTSHLTQHFLPPFLMAPQFFSPPYMFENPFYARHHQTTFKPSPPLDPAASEGFTPKQLFSPSTTPPTFSSTSRPTTLAPTRPNLRLTDKLLMAGSTPSNHTYQLKLIPKSPFLRHPMLPHPMRPPYRQHKKPLYRPQMKLVKRPFPNFYHKQPNFIVVKPTIKTTPKPQVVTPVSKVQMEPEIQTAPSFEVLAISPMFTAQPALNTGFHPSSIVVENGFKPIVQRRIDDVEPQFTSQVGVIAQNGVIAQDGAEDSALFAPMFVASPQDAVAAPAERVDSFYLPPVGQPPRASRPIAGLGLPRGGASPPDVVVTYDGRQVSGASLTRVSDANIFEGEELAQRPQFGPFRGELPPLDGLKAVNAASLVQVKGIQRGLDAPPLVETTRLKPVRGRRAAHHTEEHTAEEKLAKGGASGRGVSVVLGWLIAIFYVRIIVVN